MKKSLLTQFSFLISFFIFIFIFKGWLDLKYLPFLYGGIFGMLLPYADYFIYVYLVKPQERGSQQAVSSISQKKYFQTLDTLVKTRNQRSDLVFHTAYFQLLFLAFSFLVMTSMINLFGRGLVLAFLLHVLVDQFIDLAETKNLDFWFAKHIVIADKDKRVGYLIANFAAFLLLGFLF